MQSCTLVLKLAESPFGNKEEREELRLIEVAIDSKCRELNVGKIADIQNGGGFARFIVIGESADAIYSALATVLDMGALPHGSSIQKYRSDDDIETTSF